MEQRLKRQSLPILNAGIAPCFAIRERLPGLILRNAATSRTVNTCLFGEGRGRQHAPVIPPIIWRNQSNGQSSFYPGITGSSVALMIRVRARKLTLGTHLSLRLDARAVFFSGQPACRALFGDPTTGGFFVQKIELQKADVDRSPFAIVQVPDEVPATDATLPMKERTAVDRDLLLGPEMSCRKMIPPHGDLASRVWLTLVKRRVNEARLAGRLANS